MIVDRPSPLVEIPISPLRFALLVLAILLLSGLAANALAKWPYDAVCELHNGQYGGSATLVAYSEDGKRARLLSCWHVFDEGVRSPYVQFSSSPKKFYCKVLGMDARADLSALEIFAPEGIETPLCVRAASKSDNKVVAVGFPWYGRSGKPHFSTGRFLGYEGKDAHFTAPVHSGYSGGALFAEDGAFIGVVCGYGTNYSYAPAGECLLRFASKYVEVQR